ncbi:hypothetical protein IQ264_29025 [Phormidium sp. LEGE 05292]|uniref:hypothetical protein n=1 Tax=[Phormidium] sp. LEGE 05292 TaxID=767427 RepID=UPI00187FB991|nr:hypothetical protein [Phormidium sp. LEGE 05292]MBE9229453.1 hypothetical protein [Phormidium sp. LEGE 05292]
MNYEYSHPRKQNLQLDSLEEEIILGLQICGELLVQSKDIMLGALAYQGWLEHGRCLVIVNLPNVKEVSGAIELPMGLMLHNDPGVKLFGAEELLKQYNPQTEGLLVISHTNSHYSMACACIFAPSFPPRICYEEIISRPSEFNI